MKKLILILLGVLFFLGCAVLEDYIKPEAVNPLLHNLRVTRSWAEEGNLISTLDAKWTKFESFEEMKKLLIAGDLQVMVINRDTMGWDKNHARIYGTYDKEGADMLWERAGPAMDLIDLAIPAEKGLSLEWFDQYSQYRILFDYKTAGNIDKLNSYIDKMIALDAMPKATSREWTDEKIRTQNRIDKWRCVRGGTRDKGDTMSVSKIGGLKGSGGVRGKSNTMSVGKGSGDIIGPDPRPLAMTPESDGGPVTIGRRPDMKPTPEPAPGGPILFDIGPLIVGPIINGSIGPHPAGRETLFKPSTGGGPIGPFGEKECLKPRPGGGPPARGYSDRGGSRRNEMWWPRAYPAGPGFDGWWHK